MKKPFYTCTVSRIKEVQHGTLNVATGERVLGKCETLTEACESPLFSEREKLTGICASCAKGWDHPENKFASAEEKARALASIG